MQSEQLQQFEVNPKFSHQVIKVGQEQTPVIILDDFFINPETIQRFAIEHGAFNHDESSYYPGVRTPLPKPYVIAVLNAIYQMIYDVYNIPVSYTHLTLPTKRIV